MDLVSQTPRPRGRGRPLFDEPSEGHNPPSPRGSPRKIASHRVLRGLCGGLFEGSAGSLRGSAGFSEGSDPILVTLGNCWKKDTYTLTRHECENKRPENDRSFQKFRKGVGEQRGLVRGDPSYAKDSDLFAVPFFLCNTLRRRGTQFWG